MAKLRNMDLTVERLTMSSLSESIALLACPLPEGDSLDPNYVVILLQHLALGTKTRNH